ncbi:UBP-type zinc finger domain-containing protein [Costertonia aggregata]|uniref:UBP-type zinc finger domain-containing protein n=1 Tax=Costertonia aggregata TaxID=343403 RepID=A0A7H9AQ23_9FLAO|nr:UBP-type zinc finger domain-containing protein [Costertonia aggregata]QLG45540.1 UBP-type zinc finger domain-containing protein [Costertonia aggregata]
MALRARKCEHLQVVSKIKKPKSQECNECIKTGDSWVHLRTCQDCGITLCCDSSPNKHASKHSTSHGHPVIISAEPNEKWMWCYVHQQISRY